MMHIINKVVLTCLYLLFLLESIATSQPLATSIGLHILRCGGNAADASVAVAAALAVVRICCNILRATYLLDIIFHFSADTFITAGTVQHRAGRGYVCINV